MDDLRARLQEEADSLTGQIAAAEAERDVARGEREEIMRRVDATAAEASEVEEKAAAARAEAAEMESAIPDLPAEPPEATLEQLREQHEAHEQARVAAAEEQLRRAESELDVERNRHSALRKDLDAIATEMAFLSDKYERETFFADRRTLGASGDPSALFDFLDSVTADREASYRDITQDLGVQIEDESELDRAIMQLSEQFAERRESVVSAAHDFAERLETAFAAERDVLVAQYRTSCVRNNELRHHLHRGTHNARPTQLSERERKVFERQHDVNEAVHSLRSELEGVQGEIAELDRRAKASSDKSAISDQAYERSREQRKLELKDTRAMVQMLQREAEQWSRARHDLELLLHYARIGNIPETVSPSRWRFALASSSTGAEAPTADGGTTDCSAQQPRGSDDDRPADAADDVAGAPATASAPHDDEPAPAEGNDDDAQPQRSPKQSPSEGLADTADDAAPPARAEDSNSTPPQDQAPSSDANPTDKAEPEDAGGQPRSQEPAAQPAP